MRKEFKKSTKETRRFVHISPSFLQTSINEDALTGAEQTANQAINSISLGSVGENGEAVWNKKFKLRIKSKNTNKFVDVNFSFGYTKMTE